MFRHRFANFRELENKGSFMLAKIMNFRISVIPVTATKYPVQRAGLVLCGSRELPEDGTPLPEHVAVFFFNILRTVHLNIFILLLTNLMH